MSLLFGAAFTAAAFFQGFYTEALCFSLALLIVWALWAVLASYDRGFEIPQTALTLAVTLWWIWLGVSATYGRVTSQGIISFWWLGTLPLVFWIYTLSPQREALWQHAVRWIAFVGVAHALTASGQWLLYAADPSGTFLNRQSLAALLNLITIPLAGYFLAPKVSPIRPRALLGAIVFLLTFGFSLIEGRGATISALIALLVLLTVVARYVPRRHIVQLVGIIVLAVALGSALGREGLLHRVGGVAVEPFEAGATRFVIWKQSWEMLKQAPWLGVGLGHYSFYWPPYRDPTDTSDGFFVHDDYLQIWIEAGVPGLLLLLALLVATLVTYARAMRRASLAPERKVELTALFAALLAIAVHSLVDFNLYVLSILVLAGLVLGRLHFLAHDERAAKVFKIAPARWVSARGYRMLVPLIAAFPLLYFLTLALVSLEYQRGLKLAESGKWEEAYASLERAWRYYPYADNVLMSKADMLRHALASLPDLPDNRRQDIFADAEESLAQAEELNPFRAQTYAVHAFLYEQNSKLVGADWFDKVSQGYAHAIDLEPRAYQIRYLYARFLLGQGERERARRVLEDGMKYAYFDVEIMIPYYAFVAKLRAESGDLAGASALKDRIEKIRQAALVVPVAHAAPPVQLLVPIKE